MVFIGRLLLCRDLSGPDRFWKRRRILSQAGHYYGRRKNCYSFAVRAVERSFKFQLGKKGVRRRERLLLWETRIDAACQELGTTFKDMRKVLNDCGLGLDRKSLQNLAIWEPRSFRGLTLLTRSVLAEQGLNSVDPPPKGVITRGML